VLTIYDIDVPVPEARLAIRNHIRKYEDIKDDTVIDMLIEKGYMELEETLLQWKQRAHLTRVLQGYVHPTGAARKVLGPNPSIEEQFNRD
jgi:NADH dehydrogenase (ubiquinone) 1 alpha subcomplex subunit 6